MNNTTTNIPDTPANSEPDQSYGDVSPHWGTTRLRLLFLTPLAAAIALIILTLSTALYQYSNSQLQKGVVRINASAQDFYGESLRYDASALQVILHALSDDETLSNALKQGNRGELLQHATPLFEDIRRTFNITHFYFTGTDRVNLLRVHAPLRYGDVIDRITMLQAESSGLPTYGVELGPLGTFTLRVVTPWYDLQTNELIGYVELGMEVDQVITKLQSFFDVQVFTVVKKEFLDRDSWESGMRTLGRTPRWDRFPNVVVSGPSMFAIPSLLAERLASEEEAVDDTNMKLLYQGSSYRVTVLPLQDASGREVADMILLTDVSAEESGAQRTVYLGSFASLFAGSLLFAFFFWQVGVIGRRIERNELKLRKLANHDSLTGLYNHRAFYSLFEDEIARASRHQRPVSLLLLDIDHFKRVNDTYGHRAGDAILRGLSERLMKRMRSIDRVCRYGGEEITVILPETNIPTAKRIAEDLRTLIEAEPFDSGDNGPPINITVSIGVATYPDHEETVSPLVVDADTALYQAKEGGRNRVCVYHPHGEGQTHRRK